MRTYLLALHQYSSIVDLCRVLRHKSMYVHMFVSSWFAGFRFFFCLFGCAAAAAGSRILHFALRCFAFLFVWPQGAYGKRNRFYEGFDFDAADNSTGELN